MRTVQIKNAHDLDGVAELWILFAPDARVLGTKFITGDEILRPFVKDLTSESLPDFFSRSHRDSPGPAGPLVLHSQSREPV
jgi:hypothetical protein